MIDHNSFNPPACCRTLLLCLAFTLCAQSLALPEDAEQPLDVVSGSLDYLLDEGIGILTGTEEQPAKMTQGSRELTGLQIRFERDETQITKVTVTGTPARFQQITKAGEEPVKVSGLTLVFDNRAQLLTVEGDGFIEQAGMSAGNCYFEYHLDSARLSAPPDRCGEQARMVFPPSNQ